MSWDGEMIADLDEACNRLTAELRAKNKELAEIAAVLRKVPDMELVSPLSAAKILVRRLAETEKLAEELMEKDQ